MKLKSIKIRYLENGVDRVCRSAYRNTQDFLCAVGYFEAHHKDCTIKSISVVEVDTDTPNREEVELSKLDL